MPSPTPLRHQPSQQRGQRRVDQILRQAEAVFAEVGFGPASTNMIAERAGISIGSLYQFFSNKEQILEAMAERYLAQTLKALEERLDIDSVPDPNQFTDDMIAMLVKQQERRPYFLQCLGSNRPSPVLNKAVDDLNEAVAQHVVTLLVRLGSEAPPAHLKLQARVCVTAMGALLPLVVYARGRQRTLAAQEIRHLLVAYMSPTPQRKTST